MLYRAKLIREIEVNALKRGDFTLASGRKSSYYLDIKNVTLRSTGLETVIRSIVDHLSSEKLLSSINAVAGLTVGADPLVCGLLRTHTAIAAGWRGGLIRKETKAHGTAKYIEGPITPGDSVLIVEDVVTTGESAMQAVRRVVEFGCRVVKVIGVVDRLEGGAALFEKFGVPFSSLLTVRDLGIEPTPIRNYD